jgi:hypothetical protein
MVIEEEVVIEAPPPIVWAVLTGVDNWKEWNGVCGGARCLTPSGVAEGACISFILRPFLGIPIRISPEVVQCAPGREIIWKGSRLGVHAEHRFTLLETPEGSRLVSSETFHGLASSLGRLIFLPSRLHRLTERLLADVKRESEARARENRF